MTEQQMIEACRNGASREKLAAMWAESLRTDDDCDFKNVSPEILKRFSMSGLEWIVRRAWKIAEVAIAEMSE